MPEAESRHRASHYVPEEIYGVLAKFSKSAGQPEIGCSRVLSFTTSSHGEKSTSIMSPLARVVFALVCLVSGYCAEEVSIMSEYDRRLKVLTSILANDNFWKSVFKQHIYVDYHNHYHLVIIEQLMQGAKLDVHHEATTSEASSPAEASTSKAVVTTSNNVAIKPLVFLRNLFLRSERYRVGSILKLALKIVQNAFSCLAYKHAVHLLKVIRVEIGRTLGTVSNWSKKAIPSLAVIIMKMAEVEYMDGNLLKVAKFFYLYQKKETRISGTKKFSYTLTLERISLGMREYIKNNCVKNPQTEMLIADELNVFYTSSLYDVGEARDLDDKSFKKMFVSSKKKILMQVGDIPYTVGMSTEMWDEFLHLLEDENKDVEFVEIKR